MHAVRAIPSSKLKANPDGNHIKIAVLLLTFRVLLFVAAEMGCTSSTPTTRVVVIEGKSKHGKLTQELATKDVKNAQSTSDGACVRAVAGRVTPTQLQTLASDVHANQQQSNDLVLCSHDFQNSREEQHLGVVQAHSRIFLATENTNCACVHNKQQACACVHWNLTQVTTVDLSLPLVVPVPLHIPQKEQARVCFACVNRCCVVNSAVFVFLLFCCVGVVGFVVESFMFCCRLA